MNNMNRFDQATKQNISITILDFIYRPVCYSKHNGWAQQIELVSVSI
jgi:hypothetical protein